MLVSKLRATNNLIDGGIIVKPDHTICKAFFYSCQILSTYIIYSYHVKNQTMASKIYSELTK